LHSWQNRGITCRGSRTGIKVHTLMADFPSPLLNGYYEFRSGNFLEEKKRYETLAEAGQKPKTMVIACCDSRSAPETIFNAHPGEMFVVRNVANLMPPYGPDDGFHSTSAALEYAVQSLKVENIIVMGHGRCGGVGAAIATNMEPLSPGDFIGKWLELLRPSADAIGKNDLMTESERHFAWRIVDDEYRYRRFHPSTI